MKATAYQGVIRHTDLDAPRWVTFLGGLALFGTALRCTRPSTALLCGTGAVLMYRSICRDESGRYPEFAGGSSLRHSVYVHASPEACYRRWRRLEELPNYLDFIRKVEVRSPRRSVWSTHSIAGHVLQWETEITRDVANEIIGWRSLPGSVVKTAGSIRFEGTAGGTLVTLTMKYRTTADVVGKALMLVLGSDPDTQMQRMLWRFKGAVEESERAEGMDDPVDEMLDQSFPASDPPSSW